MTRRIKRAAIILAITILSIQQSALPVFANENNPPLPEDNIVIPEIFYATASSTVSEDAGEHTVTVRLSEPTTEEVRFTPTVVSDHVTDGVEFIFASQDVEQTIPAGETEKTLTISFIDDEEKEEDKTLALIPSLHNKINAQYPKQNRHSMLSLLRITILRFRKL